MTAGVLRDPTCYWGGHNVGRQKWQPTRFKVSVFVSRASYYTVPEHLNNYSRPDGCSLATPSDSSMPNSARPPLKRPRAARCPGMMQRWTFLLRHCPHSQKEQQTYTVLMSGICVIFSSSGSSLTFKTGIPSGPDAGSKLPTKSKSFRS